MKKIRKRKIAVLSAAFAICISICPSFAVSVYAEDDVSDVVSDAKALPEWVPTDFCSALDFVREHGSTYVEDNVVCIVKNLKKQRVRQHMMSILNILIETLVLEIRRCLNFFLI